MALKRVLSGGSFFAQSIRDIRAIRGPFPLPGGACVRQAMVRHLARRHRGQWHNSVTRLSPMKHQIAQILNRSIVADETVIRLGQIACFVAGIAVLALSLWKLSRLELTESGLFFGVLLSLVAPLLLIILGVLLPMTRTAAKRA